MPNAAVSGVYVCFTNRCGQAGGAYQPLQETGTGGFTFSIVGMCWTPPPPPLTHAFAHASTCMRPCTHLHGRTNARVSMAVFMPVPGPA